MFNGGFRKKSSRVFDRIGSLFAWTHIPPNVFSSLALVVAGLGALFFYLRLYIPAWFFIGIACLWDTFDGGLARAEKRVTRFGYYLEGIIDKWVEIIIYAGFAFSGYPIESFLVISATLMESYAKSRTSQVVPVGEHDWPAVGERLDRLILLNVGLVVFLFLSHVHVFGRTVRTLSVFFLVIFAMELVGGLQRVLYARRIIRAGGTGQMSVETRDVFSNEGK
jgi:archaetidylinositol phosphate synthase